MGNHMQQPDMRTAVPQDQPLNPSQGHKRWRVVTLFALLLCSNQALVSFLIPLQESLQRWYGIGEVQASLSIVLIPIICVLLSIPCGKLIDKRGFRAGVLWGGGAMAMALPIRFGGDSYAALLAGQVLLGISQPLLLNAIARMAVEWFAEPQRGKAIGICTAGMFLGLAIGLGLPPLLTLEYGLHDALRYCSLFGLLPALWLSLTLGRVPDRAHLGMAAPSRMRFLIRSPGMLPVLCATVVGCGLFNALALCLEPVLQAQGLDALTLSAAGVMMILGGVAGSLFIAQLAVLARGKFVVLALSGLGVMSTIWLLFHADSMFSVLVYASLLGGCLLPGYALLIAMSEIIAGQGQAAQANALITMSGNVGAAFGMGAVALIHSFSGSWGDVVAFLMGMAVLQMLIVTLFRSIRRL
jgi:predicted MFS family arabinose efflux permease